MRRLIFVLILTCLTLPAFGTTWFVRADGGGRYSAGRVAGGLTGAAVGCNGQADAPYPGSGTNQPCAYNDYRFLYDDQTYGNSAWVIAGGDTVIIRGCVTSTNNTAPDCRVGFAQGASANDAWCVGGNGNSACTNPTIPAGTSGQHTRILGQNYATCSTGNATNRSQLTQLYGGFGLGVVLNMSGAQFVDIECLEITEHGNCIVHGSPNPNPCSTGLPLSDYDSDGVVTDVNTHDLYMQDLWIHGHTDRGVKGPIGGLVTCQRCDIAYNAEAGWDFDDGSETISPNGIWNFLYSVIEWNGCNQEYPIVDTYPAAYCYSQSTGGYGDGVGTPPGFCMTATVDHSSFLYNTQDGLDLGHLDTPANCSLTITNSYGLGNNGEPFKWGPGLKSAVFVNNLVMSNCNRMSLPITGTPSTFNQYLSDFCRSGGGLSWNTVTGETTLIAYNTFTGYPITNQVIGCNTVGGCAGATINFENNLTLGFDNPWVYNNGGQAGGPAGFYCQDATVQPNPPAEDCATWMGTFNRNNNTYYGLRTSNFTCPTGYAAETCNNPLLVNQPTGNGGTYVETELDPIPLGSFNFYPTSGSPLVGAGVPVTGYPLDYAGVTRPNPPTEGALEPSAPTTIPASISGNVQIKGSVTIQ